MPGVRRRFKPNMTAFSVTWDYRCPFARNAHEHVLAGLDAGTQMMTVAREGCTFTGTSSFVVGPDVANANFTVRVSSVATSRITIIYREE